MRFRASVAALLATLLVVLLSAPAGAVTIAEFDVEPGAAPAAHAPYRIRAWPDGNLHYTDQGTSRSIGRISPAGERLQPQTLSSILVPSDLMPEGTVTLFTGPAGLLFFNPQSGLAFPRDNTAPSVALAFDAAGTLVYDRLGRHDESRATAERMREFQRNSLERF